MSLASLSATTAWPLLDMAALHTLRPDFDLLSFAECQQRQCMVAYNSVGEKVWVVANTDDTDLFDWALESLGSAWVVSLHWAQAEDLTAALARYENELSALDTIAVESSLQPTENSKALELSLASIAQNTSPVVKLVDSTLYDALQAGASDIHLESEATGMTIKYRIDGVLAVFGRVESAATAEQVISRIKVLAELDIAERRTPQDGRFKIKSRGRDVDLRVSIMPSIEGEDAVLRLLDRRALAQEMSAGLNLEGLGFDTQTLTAIRQLCRAPYGMVLELIRK